MSIPPKDLQRLQDLQHMVTTKPLDEAWYDIIYALKEEIVTVRMAVEVAHEAQASHEAQETAHQVALQRLAVLLQTIDSVMIDVFLQRLREECSKDAE